MENPSGGHGGTDLPTTLFVRNLRYDCRDKDIRRPFGKFGAIENIYLPMDYNTREPRGFGFVRFVDHADAAEAKQQMDGCFHLGRKLSVSYAERNEKKPSDYQRARDGGSGRYRGRFNRRRSPSRYCRSPPQRDANRSVSPRDRGDSGERSYGGWESRGRSYSRSPQLNSSRSRIQRPAQGRRLSRSRSRSVGRSRSLRRSPRHKEEYRSESNREDRRSRGQ